VPNDKAWKVIPSTDTVAWRVAGLLWAIIGVWLVDQLLVLTDVVVFTPYHLSVLRSAGFAASYGILIATILLTIQNGPIMRKAAFNGWRGWLFSFVGVIAGLTLIAMLLSYESLARFIGTHAVSTAGVLWIMYLLHLAAETISSISVISGAPIDDDLDEDEDMGAPSLLTIRIIVSLLLDIAILAVGITILLLLWRFDWVEVKGWIQAAFFGFQFGNLHLSLQSLLIALGVFALGLVLTRFVQRWLTGRVFAGRRADQGVHESLRVGIGYLGFVLSALAGISYLGVDFSNLAIVAGALSVGIGFGLQSIFNNFVSGLILLVERPIKIGDYIQVGGEEGTVKKISVRSTEIETIHKQSVIIPNATLITDPVTNWMHLDKSCRLDVAVGVDYGTDVELLRSTLLDVARAHRGMLKSPPPVVHFSGFGDSSLDFELRVFLRDVRDRIKSSSDLRFAILTALRDAGISIPFPQRDIHVKDGKGARRI
jgi:potassium-dependent mechanosensitive channel